MRNDLTYTERMLLELGLGHQVEEAKRKGWEASRPSALPTGDAPKPGDRPMLAVEQVLGYRLGDAPASRGSALPVQERPYTSTSGLGIGAIDRGLTAIDTGISSAGRAIGLRDAPPPEAIDEAGLAKVQAEEAGRAERIADRRYELGTSDPKSRGQVMRLFDSLAAGLAGSFGSSAEYIGRKTGVKWLEETGARAQEEAEALMPEDPNFVEKLGQAGGSMLGFFVPGLGVKAAVVKGAVMLANVGKAAAAVRASRAATPAAALASTALESAGVAQEAYDKALKATGNEKLAEERALWAGLASAPIVYVTDKLGVFGDLGGFLRRAGTAFATEAVQEGAQNIATNIAGYSPIGEGVAEGMLFGGLAGGGVVSVQQAIEKLAERQGSDRTELDSGQDVVLTPEGSLTMRELVKAAEANPNFEALLAKSVSDMNEKDGDVLLRKLAEDGHEELAENIRAAASDPDSLSTAEELLQVSSVVGLEEKAAAAISNYLSGSESTSGETVAEKQQLQKRQQQLQERQQSQQPSQLELEGTSVRDDSPSAPSTYTRMAPEAVVDAQLDAIEKSAPQPETADELLAEQLPTVAEEAPAEAPATASPGPLHEPLFASLEEAYGQKFDRNSVRVVGDEYVKALQKRGQLPNGFGNFKSAMKKAFGIDVIWVDVAEGGVKLADGRAHNWNGVSLRGRNLIAININPKSRSLPLLNTLGHELAHQMKQKAPEIWTVLRDAAVSRVARGAKLKFDNALLESLKQENPKATPEQLAAIMESESTEELVSEVVGEQWESPEYWDLAFSMAPSRGFAAQIKTAVMSLLDRVKRAFTGAGFVRANKDIEYIRRVVANAFTAWEAKTRSQKGPVEDIRSTVERVTGVAKKKQPLPSGISKDVAEKQRAENARNIEERIQAESARTAYGLQDGPGPAESGLTRSAEGKAPTQAQKRPETVPDDLLGRRGERDQKEATGKPTPEEIVARAIKAQTKTLAEIIERATGVAKGERYVPLGGNVKGARVKQKPLLYNRDLSLQIARNARIVAEKGSLTRAEIAALTAAALKHKVPPKMVLAEARRVKKAYPAEAGWDAMGAVGIDEVKVNKKGEKKVKIKWREIEYTFNRPPGATRAPNKHDQKWARKVADALVAEVQAVYARAAAGDKNAMVIVRHAGWYRNMVERLRAEFGAAGDFFADLLGATSPSTPVPTNWKFAIDIIKQFSRGAYRKELAAFEAWVESGRPVKDFPRIYKIRQLSGKLYGINSVNAMKAMLQLWRGIEAKQAPKARNFALNLIGGSDMATIDVWAARLLQRLANSLAPGKYKRVPVPAETSVSGVWNADGTEVTGAYGFGAMVMDMAARDLRNSGIDLTPPDLHAVGWFIEKELWAKNNWTTKTGEGGSFELEADKSGIGRLIAGVSIQQDSDEPADTEMSAAQQEIVAAVNGDDEIIAFRAEPTLWLYADTIERSFDVEISTTRRFKPHKLVETLARLARKHNQYDLFISRVLQPNEVSPNARPGVEIYLKTGTSEARAREIADTIRKMGVDGFTLAVDPRETLGKTPGSSPQRYVGLRIQYVPEIDMRWNDEAREALGSGDQERIDAWMQKRHDQMQDVVNEIVTDESVAYAAIVKYDTVVIGKENYDAYADGRLGEGHRPPEGEAWFGNPLREALAAAARRYTGERGPESGAGVSDGSGTSFSRALESDAQKQLAFLAEEAKKLGYESVEELVAKDAPAFVRIAEKWRELHPALSFSRDRVGTEGFRRWNESNKLVYRNGMPFIAYHGTLSEPEALDPSRSGKSNNMGAGIYASSDPEDASRNYASPLGPDVRFRINWTVDDIVDKYGDEEIERIRKDLGLKSRAEAIESLIREELGMTNEGFVMPLFIRMTKPAVLGAPRAGVERDLPETRFEGDDLEKLVSLLSDLANNYNNAERGIGAVIDSVMEDGSVTLSKLHKLMLDNVEAYDPYNGDYATRQFFQDVLVEMGHDGIVDQTVSTKFKSMLLKPDTTHFVVFDPVNVKSALGNSGEFSLTDPRVTFSRAPTKGERFVLPAETRARFLQRKLQDRFNRVKVVQEAVKSQGGAVNEASDVYRAEERYSGRAGARIERFKERVVKPLIERMARAGIEIDELGLYLYAKHAEERNSWIAQINPKFPDGGSGMTNEEARRILADFASDPRAKEFEELAKQVYEINRAAVRLMVESGLITPAIAAAWAARSKFYVPLKGFEKIDEWGVPSPGTGRGFDMRGPESRRAMGRESRAGQILENVILGHERAVVRSEKNRVGKALLNFVLMNPDKRLWEVDRRRMVPAFHKDGAYNAFGLLSGEVRYRSEKDRDPNRTIVVKHNGIEYTITVNDKVMLEAMTGKHGLLGDGESVSSFWRALGAFNRFIAKMWTALNPVFTAINFSRDASAAVIGTYIERDVKAAARVASKLFSAMKGIHEVERGGTATGEWARWYEQYKEDGGKFGMLDFGNLEDKQRELANLLKHAQMGQRGGAKAFYERIVKAFHATEDFILDYNSVIENAARLAAYRDAIESGKSRAEAASLAKNLTVNFNRKGEWSSMIGALYLFYNPSVQGVARIGQLAARHPAKTSAVVGVLTGLGFLLAALASADKDDDDEAPLWDTAVPNYEKSKNLVFMLGGGERINIPLPYGWGWFVSLGYVLNGLMRGQPPAKMALQLADSFVNHFSPLGGVDNPTALLAPTVVDPIIEIATGMNAFGGPLLPEGKKMDGTPIPNSQRMWANTRGTMWEGLAKFLNEMTGGTEVESGWIDVSPEQMKAFVRGYTGGLGNFVVDTITTIDVATDAGLLAAIERQTVPFAKQFYKPVNSRGDQAYFYGARDRVLQAAAAAKAYMQSDKPELLERLDRNAPIARLGESVRDVNEVLSYLRKSEQMVKNDESLSGRERHERLMEIDSQRREILRAWNSRFYAAERETRGR